MWKFYQQHIQFLVVLVLLNVTFKVDGQDQTTIKSPPQFAKQDTKVEEYLAEGTTNEAIVTKDRQKVTGHNQ